MHAFCVYIFGRKNINTTLVLVPITQESEVKSMNEEREWEEEWEEEDDEEEDW